MSDATGDSGLGAGMVEAERRLLAERPAKVVLQGFDDDALATALVAAKLLIPIELAEGPAAPADPAQEVNRRLIGLLAG